jgi:hypothetical protein
LGIVILCPEKAVERRQIPVNYRNREDIMFSFVNRRTRGLSVPLNRRTAVSWQENVLNCGTTNCDMEVLVGLLSIEYSELCKER